MSGELGAITFRDLLEVCGPRDLATIEEIIQDRQDQREPQKEVGVAQFHES